jgi:hypothetical protein
MGKSAIKLDTKVRSCSHFSACERRDHRKLAAALRDGPDEPRPDCHQRLQGGYQLRMRGNKVTRVGWLAFAALALISFFAAMAPATGSPVASPWVGLANGRLGDYRWTVKIKRQEGRAGAGQDGALRPCILVRTKWEVGDYNYRRSSYRACAQAPGHLDAKDPPLVGSGVQPGAGAAPGVTAVGMVVARAVKRVRVVLANGTGQTIRLHQLSRRQASAAELGRFRYAAFAVHGEWCAKRVITLNAGGAALWDSGEEEDGCETGL